MSFSTILPHVSLLFLSLPLSQEVLEWAKLVRRDTSLLVCHSMFVSLCSPRNLLCYNCQVEQMRTFVIVETLS